jgi:hypothetical protein
MRPRSQTKQEKEMQEESTTALISERIEENLDTGAVRYLGVPSCLINEPNQLTQLYFAEDATTGKFGKLVTRRTVTRDGVTVTDEFDPPRDIAKLPRPKFPASEEPKAKRKRRDPNDKRSRVMRLAKRKAAAD